MRLQFISQSKAETSFPLKKKKRKEKKRGGKKATMSPESPSAWFMEMHLPIFFPPIIGKYSNKSENVRQFSYHLVGYPNTLSSEKPRDVTVTRRNITRVEGWPKKGGAIKITITHFQHRMEDHRTKMCSPLSLVLSGPQHISDRFCRNNACCLQTGFTTQRRKCSVYVWGNSSWAEGGAFPDCGGFHLTYIDTKTFQTRCKIPFRYIYVHYL